MWLWSRSNDATWGMTWECGACSGSPMPGAVDGSLWSAHWPDAGPWDRQALVTQNASRETSCLSSVERAWGPTVLGLTDIRWIHLEFFFLISSLSLKWTIECHSSFELADLGIGWQVFNLSTTVLLLLIFCFLLVVLFYFCQHDREYEQRLVNLMPLAALHSIYVCMYLFCSASDQTRALHMLGKHSLSSLMVTY